MNTRHLLRHLRDRLFENRSIRDQLEEYFLLGLILVLGSGLLLITLQRFQLSQQLLQNLQQQVTLLQQRYHLQQTEKE